MTAAEAAGEGSRSESPLCRLVICKDTVRSMGGLWNLAFSTFRAYKVRGDDAVAGVTRIDGCPGVPSGPFKTPADDRAFASNRAWKRPPRRAIFLPRRSPPAAGEGGAAGEKDCQDRGSRDAKASMPLVSAGGPRCDKKSNKMLEWGLTTNLIDGGGGRRGGHRRVPAANASALTR